MRSILDKRGQVNAIGPSVIALVIAGVFLILGLVILQEIRDTDIVSEAATESVVNETLTTVTETGEALTAADACLASCSVTSAVNGTDGAVIVAANYTVSGCTVTYVGVGNYNNSDWIVTYTYTRGDEACLAGNATIVGLGTFADFWEIIVLAIVITIVIGLLLIVFGGRRVR